MGCGTEREGGWGAGLGTCSRHWGRVALLLLAVPEGVSEQETRAWCCHSIPDITNCKDRLLPPSAPGPPCPSHYLLQSPRVGDVLAKRSTGRNILGRRHLVFCQQEFPYGLVLSRVQLQSSSCFLQFLLKFFFLLREGSSRKKGK